MRIHQTILTDNMFASMPDEPSAKYMAEMKTRYEQALTQAYQNAFPDADVTIYFLDGHQGCSPPISTDVLSISEEQLRAISQNVFEGLEWPDEEDPPADFNCPKCGAGIDGSGEPVTVSGWYGPVRFEWKQIGGVRTVKATAVRCPDCGEVPLG